MAIKKAEGKERIWEDDSVDVYERVKELLAYIEKLEKAIEDEYGAEYAKYAMAAAMEFSGAKDEDFVF